MELNKAALIDVLNEKYNGNFSQLARELGLDNAHVYRVLQKDRNCGAKFFSCIIRWCNENGLDYRNFIFLT